MWNDRKTDRKPGLQGPVFAGMCYDFRKSIVDAAHFGTYGGQL